MYQGDYEYQGQTGYLMGQSNEPPAPRGKGVGLDNIIIFREP